MRVLLILSVTVVMAAALAPTATAQVLYGQPPSGNVGLIYTHWKLDGLDTSGTLDQWVVPLNGFVPIRDDMEARFYIAQANNTLKEETGEYKLNGLTDMRVQLNHSFSRDRYLVSAGLNLPTGKTGLDLGGEWLVMNVLTQNFLAFPVRRLGEGFGVNLMAGAATTWGTNRLGASASYNYTGSYEAYAGEGQYNPGDSLLLTAGIQGDRANWIWNGDLSYTTSAIDELEGLKVYSQGDQFGIHAGGGLKRDDLRATVDLRYLIRGRNEIFDATESLASRLKVYGNEFGLGGKVAWVKPSGLNFGPLLELRLIQGNEYDFGASQIFGLGGVAGYPLGQRLNLNGALKFYTGNTDDGDIDLSGYQFSLSLSGHL